MRAPRGPLVSTLLGLALVAACAGSGSPLATGDDDAGGAAGAAGTAGAGAGAAAGKAGKAGAAGKAGGAGSVAAGEAGAAGDDGGLDAPPDVWKEPDGVFELRMMSGIADADLVRLCLVAWDGTKPLATPSFAPSAALALGESVVVTPPDPPVAVRPYVLSGAVAGITGDCAGAVLAPPKDVRVGALPSLPASLWAAKRSVLLVAAGCAGGVALKTPGPACGNDTTPTAEKLTLHFTELSRGPIPSGFIGVQLFHASSSFGAVQVRVLGDGAEQPTIVLAKVDPGEIDPRPPAHLAPDVFGFVPSAGTVQIGDYQGGDIGPSPIAPAMTSSGLATEELAGDHGFVWVVVGARPSLAMGAGHPMRVVWLRAPK